MAYRAVRTLGRPKEKKPGVRLMSSLGPETRLRDRLADVRLVRDFRQGKCSSTLSQFFLFLICGGTAALVNLVVGYLLYEGLGMKEGLEYQGSVVLAGVTGGGVTFFLNRHVTFRDFSRGVLAQGRTFLIVALVGLGLTVTLSSLFRGVFSTWFPISMEIAGLHASNEAIAHVLAVFLVAFYNFAAYKFLTFRQGIRVGVRTLVGRVRR